MTVLRFSTQMFDFTKAERPTINPIYGHSLAELLRQEFKALGHEVDECVEEEDWGWYFYTRQNDQNYMIGTCAYVDADEYSFEPIITSEPIEHLVQFDKTRTFKEVFWRKNKFTQNEPIISLTEEVLKRKINDMTQFSRED